MFLGSLSSQPSLPSTFKLQVPLCDVTFSEPLSFPIPSVHPCLPIYTMSTFLNYRFCVLEILPIISFVEQGIPLVPLLSGQSNRSWAFDLIHVSHFWCHVVWICFLVLKTSRRGLTALADVRLFSTSHSSTSLSVTAPHHREGSGQKIAIATSSEKSEAFLLTSYRDQQGVRQAAGDPAPLPRNFFRSIFIRTIV